MVLLVGQPGGASCAWMGSEDGCVRARTAWQQDPLGLLTLGVNFQSERVEISQSLIQPRPHLVTALLHLL